METVVTLRILAGIGLAIVVVTLLYLLIKVSNRSNTYNLKGIFPIQELPLVFSTGGELEHVPEAQTIDKTGLVVSRLSNGTVTIIYKYFRNESEYTESFELSHPEYLGLIIQTDKGVLKALQRVGGKILYDPVLTQRERASVLTFMRLTRAQVRKKVRK